MTDQAASRFYIGAMRGNLGLEETDTSRDEEIEKMTPERRLQLVCGWHLGDRSWAGTVIAWARDCGFKIEQ